MMDADQQQRWREGIRAFEDAQKPGDEGPDAELLWKALAGDLESVQRREVIASALDGPQGHEEARLFVELQRELAGDAKPAPKAQPSSRAWVAAVVVLAAAALVWVWSGRDAGPPVSDPGAVRAPEDESLSSLVDTQALPRDAFELRWTDLGSDCSYSVRASTAEAEVVVDVARLTAPRHTVPASELAYVPPDGVVFWQVDFECASHSGQSKTFSTAVRR